MQRIVMLQRCTHGMGTVIVAPISIQQMIIKTHWDRLTHICVGNLTIIGSDNGLSPGRRQAIIWINAVNIVNWPLRNKFQWNFNKNSNIFIHENMFESVVCDCHFVSASICEENTIRVVLASIAKPHSRMTSWLHLCNPVLIWLTGWLVLSYVSRSIFQKCFNLFQKQPDTPICKFHSLFLTLLSTLYRRY